jgi:hypothetical protein
MSLWRRRKRLTTEAARGLTDRECAKLISTMVGGCLGFEGTDPEAVRAGPMTQSKRNEFADEDNVSALRAAALGSLRYWLLVFEEGTPGVAIESARQTMREYMERRAQLGEPCEGEAETRRLVEVDRRELATCLVHGHDWGDDWCKACGTPRPHVEMETCGTCQGSGADAEDEPNGCRDCGGSGKTEYVAEAVERIEEYLADARANRGMEGGDADVEALLADRKRLRGQTETPCGHQHTRPGVVTAGVDVCTDCGAVIRPQAATGVRRE